MSIRNDSQYTHAEITCQTSKIETNYPELYRFLDENPMTGTTTPHPELDMDSLREYLEDLKNLLKQHLQIVYDLSQSHIQLENGFEKIINVLEIENISSLNARIRKLK